MRQPHASATRTSVVIPAYNAAGYLAASLASVLAQTDPDFEIVLVDDGSTDATPDIAASIADPRLRLFRQANAGVSAARNLGVAAAIGARILFHDADDILAPDALQRLNAALDADPEAVFAYGEGVSFDAAPPDLGPDACEARPAMARRPSGRCLARFLVANPIRLGAVLVRAEAAREVGGFPEHVALGEDWVFWCALAALGPVAHVPGRPMVAYRRHAASALGRLEAGAEAMRPAFDAMFSLENVVRAIPSETRRALRRKAEASADGLAASELLKRGDFGAARARVLAALRRRPGVIRSWVLFACALARRLPSPVRARLA